MVEHLLLVMKDSFTKCTLVFTHDPILNYAIPRALSGYVHLHECCDYD